MGRTVMRPWVVLKFGGTSVSSRQAWETIGAVCRERLAEGLRPVVVCSAAAGVSNQIEQLLDAAVAGGFQRLIDRIVARHTDLCRELGVPPGAVRESRDLLSRVALGVSLTGECTPRLRALAMAQGELLSTRIGAAFLSRSGLGCAWVDARECLESEPEEPPRPEVHFLNAQSGHAADRRLARRLARLPQPVVVTQGFIARDPAGETVLLGRGGSDTSAAYLAARLSAVRCEIWTDVRGIYSADPRILPHARLLRSLGYDEAQEIVSMGAKVLHPRCLSPVRQAGIPLYIKSTGEPAAEGTIVTDAALEEGPDVKAISTKGGITLISMESLSMWRQVGFLADIFAVFRARGLSIDMVSTSETNVTVSLDRGQNNLDHTAVDGLLSDLGRFCRARAIGPCAYVSLVGRNIRAILHRLGPVLKVFEEQKVYLVSQAASDLNLTFAVDEEQAARLVRELHALLFPPPPPDGPEPEAWPEAWWRRRRAGLVRLARQQGPCYVYDRDTLAGQAARLARLDSVDRVLYAMKANPHPEILTLFHDRGLGFECVSQAEFELLERLFPGICRQPDRVLFTPNFAPQSEYAAAFERGATVTLDGLHPLEAWPELFRGRQVFVRLDPGRGRGHHRYVHTAGEHSKFGVVPAELDRLEDLLRATGTTVTGLHAHTGSGILDPNAWRETALFLAGTAARFPEARVLDLGGGLGVPYRPAETPLDLEAVDRSLAEVKTAFPGYRLWIEPGRFLVAEAGVLLATVTQVKRKGEFCYVGIDTGMNSLIRPMLYGSYHHIVNLSRPGRPADMTATVVGPICESGDTLGHHRRIADAQEGDVLLIATAGAYGRVMSSRYNLREPAVELLVVGARRRRGV